MHKRLFIAVKIHPSDVLLRKVAFLKSHLNRELINWIRDDHYHITLRFLGKTPLRLIPKIEEALQKVAAQQEDFLFRIHSVGVFGSAYKPTVLWLGIAEQQLFGDLYKSLTDELNAMAYHADGQNFIPHISIARIKKIGDKKFFQMLLNKVDDSLIQTQQAGELILYESILGSKGAEYQVVNSFKLRT